MLIFKLRFARKIPFCFIEKNLKLCTSFGSDRKFDIKMTFDFVSQWDKCLAIIKDNVKEEAYNSFFAPIIPIDFKDNALTVQVPSHFIYEFLEEQYRDLLKKAITRTFGTGVDLLYQVTMVQNPTTVIETESTKDSSFVEKSTKTKVKTSDPFQQRVFGDLDPQLNSKYTFANYYIGESNRMARAAGELIAQKPGDNPFNPMFLYGESGVGKTHLLHAIGIQIKENMPQKRVLYISANLFQVQYTNAVVHNTVNDFINFYQSIDVLLIDDIQELANKTQTQNTFFHIFNHLHQNRKQLVMTSDRPPISLTGMVPRLISRFKWGLTTELERPDYELRRNILINKIKRDGLSISEEVIDFITRNVTESVRDLEGIIVSLMAHSTIFNREITLDLAERILNSNIHLEKKQITIELIQETVCKYFDLDPKVLQMKCRKREIVQARQISMYLSKKLTDLSYSHIGNIIGRKDHATVLYACKTIGEQMDIDKKLRTSIEEIEQQLR